MQEMQERLLEVCANCGLPYGSHSATNYKSKYYGMYIPRGYCPGNANKMNWDMGGGTVFKASGDFTPVDYGTPARNRKEG